MCFVLAWALANALLIFTQVIAPVAAIHHQSGVQILWYLDDWLVLAPSLPRVLTSWEMIFGFLHGIVLNL